MAAREKINLRATHEGRCEWCGSKIRPHRRYCCPDHRTKYNNWLASKGKVIVPAVLTWARHRGAADKPNQPRASGMLGIIRDAADDFNRETRARIAEFEAAREADHAS